VVLLTQILAAAADNYLSILAPAPVAAPFVFLAWLPHLLERRRRSPPWR
jgi:hypothetical protein